MVQSKQRRQRCTKFAATLRQMSLRRRWAGGQKARARGSAMCVQHGSKVSAAKVSAATGLNGSLAVVFATMQGPQSPNGRTPMTAIRILASLLGLMVSTAAFADDPL